MSIRSDREAILREAITSAGSPPYAFGSEPSLAANSEATSYRFTGGALTTSLDERPIFNSLIWDVDCFSADRGTLFRRVDAIALALTASGFSVTIGGELETDDEAITNVTLTAEYGEV